MHDSMFAKKIALFFFASLFSLFAQSKEFSGRVIDAKTLLPLSFANIRIQGTTIGTASDINGNFKFYGPNEDVKIIASYIGYLSDTIYISRNKKAADIIFQLIPIAIQLKEVFVSAKYNPADDIISKVLKRKKIREQNLITYKFNVYTKGVIKNLENSSDIKVPENISLIFENYGEGKFKKPDKYVETILARRQTANLPPTANLLTGARLLKSFYEDNIPFVFSTLKSPISYDALDFYEFLLIDTTVYNNHNIFIINFQPKKDYHPGFIGTLYVRDKDYNVIKIEATINNAANIANFFRDIRIIQQFDEFKDSLFMPIDYRLFATGNPLGLANFTIELNSIFHNYRINDVIYDKEFNLTILKTLPEADKRDSIYWTNKIFLQQTDAEKLAIKKIDSAFHSRKNNLSLPSIFLQDILLFDNVFVGSPSNIYRFNKVEGNALELKLKSRDLFEERLDADLFFGRGFDDKKNKAGFLSYFKLGDYRDYYFKFDIYENIQWLFYDDYKYSNFSSNILALFFKNDIRNYFYAKSFELGFGLPISESFSASLSFNSKRFSSAATNTNYSIFKRDKFYKSNLPIEEFLARELCLAISLDFRRIIENGRKKIRIYSEKSNYTINAKIRIFDDKYLRSQKSFNIFEFNTNYVYRFSNGITAYLFAETRIGSSGIPVQYFSSLPGIVNGLAKDYSFRNLKFAEYVGSKVYRGHFELNFKDKVFKNSLFSFLSWSDLFFSYSLSAGYTSLRKKEILAFNSFNFQNRKKPFVETGFSLWHPLFPVKFEFFWSVFGDSKTKFSFNINSIVY